MRERRWLQARGQILRGWIRGRDQRCEQRDDEQKYRDGESDSSENALAEKLAQFVERSHESLTRGSITEYKTSVSRLTRTYESEITRMQPWSKG